MATSGQSENCLARTVTPQLSEIHQVRHKCSREDTEKSSKYRDGKEAGTRVTCAYAQLQCKTLFCSAWSPITSPFPRRVWEETRLGRTVSPWLCQHHPRPHGPLSGQRSSLQVPIAAARPFSNCENKRAIGPRRKICGNETPPKGQRGPQSFGIGTVAPRTHISGNSPVQSEKNQTPLSGNCTDFRWSAPWHLCPARLICACSATVAGRSQNAPLFQVCVGF